MWNFACMEFCLSVERRKAIWIDESMFLAKCWSKADANAQDSENSLFD